MPYYDLLTRQRLADVRLGFRVDRDTATLPQTTNHALFNIAGGRVLMTAIIGEVTTAIGGADNTKLTAYPTVATAGTTDICANLDIDTCDVGDILSITGTPADAMLVAHGGAAQTGKAVVLPIGTLNLACAANRDGAIKWSLFYFPLDDGAYVEASTVSTATSQFYDEASRQRIRDIILGCRVDKTATILPNTTYSDLFNIAGGKVLVAAMIGECTVAVGGANACKFFVNPTVATSPTTDLCTAVDINTDDIGDLLSMTGTPGDGLLVAHKGAVQIGYPVIVQTGTIGIHAAGNTAGTFKWMLFYVPIDVGATVTAA
jgi:hypothetical protein